MTRGIDMDKGRGETVQEADAREAKALRIEQELTKRADILDRSRRHRRPYIGWSLVGLAVLVVVLAVIGWAFMNDQQNTERLRVCMAVNGTWINGNTCVPPRDAK